MLTAQQIRDIAAMHDIQVTNHWYATSMGNDAPILSRMSLVFTREAPEAWDVLMSTPKEVAISISGTRQTALSRPVDGMHLLSMVAQLAPAAANQEIARLAHA